MYNLYAIGWLDGEDLCYCIASSLQVGSVAEGKLTDHRAAARLESCVLNHLPWNLGEPFCSSF